MKAQILNFLDRVHHTFLDPRFWLQFIVAAFFIGGLLAMIAAPILVVLHNVLP